MIDRIDSPQEFERLRTDWNALLRRSRSNCLFLTWEWLHTWWEHLSDHRQLFLLRARSETEVLGLLPLARGPARIASFQPSALEFLGSGSVGSDYLDFIIREDREPEVLAEAGAYLMRQRTFLTLSQMNRQSATAAGLAALWRLSDAQYRESAINVCPVINLAGRTWDSYLNSLGAEHRYNFRRRLKRLTARFTMRFETVRCEDERRAALSRLIALHELRRTSLGGSEAFQTPALRAFHEELTRLALQRSWLRLYTLWLDQTPAAALYGFLYNGVFYFYQSGFDPHFSAYSVGLVAMGLAIRSAIEDGAREYDLLHGAEQYKFLWAREARDLSRLDLYPPGLRGAMWRTAREWNRELRTMVRKVLSTRPAGPEVPSTIKSGGTAYAVERR